MDEKLFLTLLSDKIKIIIIGGGRAACIKLKTFLSRKCSVWILSKEFSDEFNEFKDNISVHSLIGEYDKKYIYDKHIVVIATNDKRVNSIIRKDCRELHKIYIDSSDVNGGNCIVPCQRNTESIHFAVNTRKTSPKTSVFIADIIKEHIEKYDDFVNFTSHIRNKLSKGVKRKQVMEFLCSRDFYFFYSKKKAQIIIDMFYGDIFKN